MALPAPVETVDADVLVVGGGFAGAWAALRAAELGARTILIEKAFVSRAGASTMSGGVTTAPFDSDDLGLWVEEFVSHGGYMADQDWALQLLELARERVKTLDAWGVPISKDEHGNIRRFASRGMINVRCMQYHPKSTLEELRRRMLAAGARIMDRVSIAELITADGCYPTTGAIVGALGFDTRTAVPYVVRAKQTILACGILALKGKGNIDNVSGDGTALAYRAGARLIDLEMGYGGTFTILEKDHHLGSYNIAVAHGAQLINAAGERIMARYDPVRFERSELTRVIAAFVKEILDGRGPCYLDLRTCDDTYWRDVFAMATHRKHVLASGDIPNPREHPLLVEPTWGTWNHGAGGVAIDLGCRASLPGLYATGANAKNKAMGTHSSAGIPTAFAMNSGYLAGQNAAQRARELPDVRLPQAQVDALLAGLFAPYERPSGGLTPHEITDRITLLELSVVDGVIHNEQKIRRKLATIDELEAALAVAGAENPHELTKYHDARNVIDAFRLLYRMSLDRTESREAFYREDYPDCDNEAWFCWHGARRTAAGPVFDKEPIPVDRFAFAMPELPPKQASPIAAIMSGAYDPAVYA
jgi:succinate dehydrogenase / fumarate reductase flavoprotein subunit